MWNRVLLLASGIGLGWNMVHLWAAPKEHLVRIRLRLGLSAGLGILVVAFWAFASWTAAALGLGLLLGVALVTYAAHARQLSRAAPLWGYPLPDRPDVDDPRMAVLLVARGEPPLYDGPAYWAQRLREVAGRGGTVPHWFLWPQVCARVRWTYAALRGGNPANAAVVRLAEALAARLGGQFAVQATFTATSPLLADALQELVMRGLRQAVLLPVGWEADPQDLLREQVGHSRAHEAGMEIICAGLCPGVALTPGSEDRRLAQWLSGQAPEGLPAWGEEALAALEREVLRYTPQTEAGDASCCADTRSSTSIGGKGQGSSPLTGREHGPC